MDLYIYIFCHSLPDFLTYPIVNDKKKEKGKNTKLKIKQGERKISHKSACSVYMTAFNLLKNASLGCKQSCSILRYTANVIQENENKKRWITFRYEFPMPMRTILYEEYVIMDLMNVVGVIGGTFGMFIGLDFSGIIDILRDYFRRRMPWCRFALPEIWCQYALQDTI